MRSDDRISSTCTREGTIFNIWKSDGEAIESPESMKVKNPIFEVLNNECFSDHDPVMLRKNFVNKDAINQKIPRHFLSFELSKVKNFQLQKKLNL